MDNLPYAPATIPQDEEERLKALYDLKVLDTIPEERFDRITKIATVLFNVPISTVTLVDSRREWFKSCQGLPNKEGERAISFCGHVVLSDEPLIIPDAKADPRFANNPMVIGIPFIEFYAGIPLKSADGKRVGAFCIKDHESRKFSNEDLELLKALSSWAELELNAHELSIAIEGRRKSEAKVVELNETLKILNKILRHDVLNDLTIIKGNILLNREGSGQNKELDDAYAAIQRSIGLITEMRELETAVSSGAALKEYEIRQVAENAAKLFPEMKIAIEGEGKAFADEALTSIIENLIRNAKMHGGVNALSIQIQPGEDFLKLLVADNGKGIPDEIKPKLFTEGFKYGETGHTGMGLYIIKKTLLRYGGNVSIENNSPQGTIFVLELPRKSSSTLN